MAQEKDTWSWARPNWKLPGSPSCLCGTECCSGAGGEGREGRGGREQGKKRDNKDTKKQHITLKWHYRDSVNRKKQTQINPT